jgi:hypothetical protein
MTPDNAPYGNKNEWRKQHDGWWTMTSIGPGYTYKTFAGKHLNIAIRATLTSMLHCPQ